MVNWYINNMEYFDYEHSAFNLFVFFNVSQQCSIIFRVKFLHIFYQVYPYISCFDVILSDLSFQYLILHWQFLEFAHKILFFYIWIYKLNVNLLKWLFGYLNIFESFIGFPSKIMVIWLSTFSLLPLWFGSLGPFILI